MRGNVPHSMRASSDLGHVSHYSKGEKDKGTPEGLIDQRGSCVIE